MKVKAAFTAWGNRIAPVFDVSRQLHLVEVEAGRIVRETEVELKDEMPVQRVLRLAELGIDTLVCGAISRAVLAMVAANGIRVIPFVAGDIDKVMQAWLSDQLESDLYVMPGCRRRGLRQQGGGGPSLEGYAMNGRGEGGRGSRGGQGQGRGGRGRGGRRRGRMGGPSAGGPSGSCVCPQCGHREPHVRGTPCTERQCPKCGVAMTRQ
jgi:predicted Fe-Mo cluster-binding NifX family protein